MYSTCIYCHTSLGTNEAIERFPVGRRIAFDAAKGRLWAVCRHCERWNLSPLEERWEAIEACERLFRDTKLRVSTQHIGLARLKEGTTLVRIGDPQRPEMAAWRYGDQFHRRRRKYVALSAVGVAVFGGVVVAGPPGLGLIGGSSLTFLSYMNLFRIHRTVARIPLGDDVLRLDENMLEHVAIRRGAASGFEIEVPHKGDDHFVKVSKAPRAVLSGDDAVRVARVVLPRINQLAGRKDDVMSAVRVLESSRGPEHLLDRFSFPGEVGQWAAATGRRWRKAERFAGVGWLSILPAPVRLAMEMSLHEEDERRALEGELAELAKRWREAEEIAAIADDMLVPAGVSAALTRLRGAVR